MRTGPASFPLCPRRVELVGRQHKDKLSQGEFHGVGGSVTYWRSAFSQGLHTTIMSDLSKKEREREGKRERERLHSTH